MHSVYFIRIEIKNRKQKIICLKTTFYNSGKKYGLFKKK